MREESGISGSKRAPHQVILGGCALLLIIALLVTGIAGVALFNGIRHSARYPGSVPVSSHTRQKLPFHFRWDNSYYTTDPFRDVFYYYSRTYDLGSESRANGDCTLLEGSQPQLRGQSHMSVLLCDGRNGRLIYVTRLTSLK